MKTVEVPVDLDVYYADKINEVARHYGKLFYEKVKNILGEIHPLVLRPAGNGLANFFKGEDGHYRIYQPITNLLMIPGNVGLTIADGFFPINTQGGLGVPMAPIFGRLIESIQHSAQLVNLNTSMNDRIKFPLSVITAATLSMYIGLQSMSIANSLLMKEGNLAASLTVDPLEIITQLAKGNPSLYHKFIIGMAGYVAATNVYVKGKEIVLHQAQEWWNELWADVKTDNLIRHLNSLQEITDANTVKRIERDFHKSVQTGKDWNAIDLTGRTLERMLSFPATLVSLPSTNTKNITLPKAFLQHNGFVKAGANAVLEGSQYINEHTPESVKKIMALLCNLLGWDSHQQPQKPQEYPNYDMVLEQVLSEKWMHPGMFNTAYNYFYSSPDRSTRQQKLDLDLINTYTRDVTRYKSGQSLGFPVMSRKNPLAPLEDTWNEIAAKNPHIQKMLNGQFQNSNAALYEKARIYNEALYIVFSTGDFVPDAENNLKLN